MMIVYDSIEVMDVISFIIRTRIGCTEMLYMHLGTTFFLFYAKSVGCSYTSSPHICYSGFFGVEIDN